jgi:hypothetical protein
MAIFSNWPLQVVPMATLAAALAACAAPPAPLVMAPEAAGVGRSESILVASARAPDPGPAIYSNERAEPHLHPLRGLDPARPPTRALRAAQAGRPGFRHGISS